MRDVQVLHLVFFLNDNEPSPGIIFRDQCVLQQRFLTRAYIDDLIPPGQPFCSVQPVSAPAPYR